MCASANLFGSSIFKFHAFFSGVLHHQSQFRLGSGLSKRMSARAASQLVGPFRLEGEVTKGFGRGSKELGIPTANFDEQVVANLPPDLETGIYFGWTLLDSDHQQLRKAVLSIGWNPYYNNTKKSVETHIMHKYPEQFYGQWLKVLICGYIRPEKNYESLQSLIDDINMDIRQAEESLEESKFKSFSQDPFFTAATNGTLKSKL